MLKLENVSKFYYNKGLISSGITKVNLELNFGEFVAITGESGSGKSTLLNVISGLDSYEEGEMYINGKETSHYTEKDFEEYRKKYIANIFQSFNLINSYTVYQNIELVLLLNGYKKRKIKKKVLDIIEKVGLTKFKNTKVSKLSGGQKQRVAIARAMVKNTPIIVADEPTGNLDSKSAKDVIEILKNVAKDKLVIVVTHNIEQIENIATRIIKMHDGRIIENVEIKKINLDNLLNEPNTENTNRVKEENEKTEEIKQKKAKTKNNNMTGISKYRLGIRNTFNIASKFILLFVVFFFVSAAILAEYASFKMSENTIEDGEYSSIAFKDLSENRIIINKENREYFTKEDYEKIKELENVDYIVEDDIFLDSDIFISQNDIGFTGTLKSIDTFRGNIDEGRNIENENEMILAINKNNFLIKNRLDDVLGKTFSINKMNGINSSEDESVQDVVIVGIQYIDDYDAKFFVSDNILSKLRIMVNKAYSKQKVFFNDKYSDYEIIPNDNVEENHAIVDDNFKYQFKNNKILGKPISISVYNIYYTKTLGLTINQTYTKSNFSKLTGLKDYTTNQNKIFVNTKDYNSLYDTPSYQSSVFVKDVKEIDKTLEQLKNMGLSPKKVTDYRVSYAEETKNILKIIKAVVTIILVIILFFISYLVIKIILKSRKVYYTTLRMLGASLKNVIKILDIELFLNSTISYLTLMLFIYLVKSNIIKIEELANLISYLTIKEYIIVYVIIFVISKIITIKFSNELFKDSAMKTYNEEEV